MSATELLEIGKKISKANMEKIRRAMKELMDMIEQPGEMEECAIDGDCIPLVEAAATANLKLISPGWGASGYYSPALLQQSTPVFKRGTKMFWDHQTAAEESAKPEGSLDRLAGELVEDARWEEQGPTGPGIYARAKVFQAFTNAVKELAPHIGVSIRASGISKQGEAEGRKGPMIEKIAAVRSVDYVTVPGRGGEIVQMFEAAGRGSSPISIVEEKIEMTEEQVKALVEAQVEPLRKETAASKLEAARLREALGIRDARDYVMRKLASITMPQVTRARLAESLPAQAPIKDGVLDDAAFGPLIEAAAKAEVEYIARISGSGQVRGMGGAALVDDEKTLAEARKRTADNLAVLTGVPAEKFAGRVF